MKRRKDISRATIYCFLVVTVSRVRTVYSLSISTSQRSARKRGRCYYYCECKINPPYVVICRLLFFLFRRRASRRGSSFGTPCATPCKATGLNQRFVTPARRRPRFAPADNRCVSGFAAPTLYTWSRKLYPLQCMLVTC